jgi:hypothetical protein
MRAYGAALAVAAVIALAPGGLPESDQIAFSLVHGESRIDVIASTVTSIEVYATRRFRNRQTGRSD